MARMSGSGICSPRRGSCHVLVGRPRHHQLDLRWFQMPGVHQQLIDLHGQRRRGRQWRRPLPQQTGQSSPDCGFVLGVWRPSGCGSAGRVPPGSAETSSQEPCHTRGPAWGAPCCRWPEAARRWGRGSTHSGYWPDLDDESTARGPVLRIAFGHVLSDRHGCSAWLGEGRT